MFCKQLYRIYRLPILFRYVATNSNLTRQAISNLCLNLDITKTNAEYICLKQPAVVKLNNQDIKELVETVSYLGYKTEVLTENPVLFGILPATLKYRYQVLRECGVIDVIPAHLISYLTLVKQRTVRELKELGILPTYLNVENRLAACMTQWPTSLTTLIYGDVEEKSLYEIRLKIIQRYLELLLDLTETEFERGIKTYPTIKHRPLATINETLSLLQSNVMIPNQKIKNNLYLVHADPENLKQIIYKVRSLGGIDIKEVLRLHPKIAMKSYMALLNMRNTLRAFDINLEAEARCFEIFTLGVDTVKERLKNAKEIPEFQALFNHPRFLKIIFYHNTAMKRMKSLYDINKKCLSLNILAGATTRYKLFEKAPGDRSGKSRDLIFCLSEAFGKTYKSSDIRNVIKRHPFWINVPIIQIKFVYDKLSKQFTNQDIYENCPILLYPWNKIRDTLKQVKLRQYNDKNLLFMEHIDHSILTSSQCLSLVLYILEEKHYFSGNGVWTEELMKNVVDVEDVSKSQLLAQEQ